MELLLMFICASSIVGVSFFQIRLMMVLIEKVKAVDEASAPTGWDSFDLYNKEYFERAMAGKKEDLS